MDRDYIIQLLLVAVQEVRVQREFEFLHDRECAQELLALFDRAHFFVHHAAQTRQQRTHFTPLRGVRVSTRGDECKLCGGTLTCASCALLSPVTCSRSAAHSFSECSTDASSVT